MTILSIIILSYNTKDLTCKCVESIVNQYKKELDHGEIEIIIVDNASTDGSPSVISSRQGRDQISNLKLIKSKENLGFSKGCNIGVKHAIGKYILFLNSDTQVLDKGLSKMTEFLDSNQKVGILGGRLLNPDNSPQSSTGKFYSFFNLSIMLLGLERLGFLRSSPNKIQKVDWVSGACMMVRREVFEKLKGFDEKLFMYMEDMEICFRAEKLGFSAYFYPNLKLKHKSLGSSNRTFAIINIYKGILHFYSKHKSRFQYIVVKQMLKMKAIIGIFVGTLIGKSSLVETYRKALKF